MASSCGMPGVSSFNCKNQEYTLGDSAGGSTGVETAKGETGSKGNNLAFVGMTNGLVNLSHHRIKIV